MDIQSLIAIIIVAVAALIAIRHLWRSISRANRKSDTPLYCEGCALKEQCEKRKNPQVVNQKLYKLLIKKSTSC